MERKIFVSIKGPKVALNRFLGWWVKTYGSPIVDERAFSTNDPLLLELREALNGKWGKLGLRIDESIAAVPTGEDHALAPWVRVHAEPVEVEFLDQSGKIVDAPHCSTCGTVDPDCKPGDLISRSIRTKLDIVIPSPFCLILISDRLKAIWEHFQPEITFQPWKSKNLSRIFWNMSVAHISLQAGGTPIKYGTVCPSCKRPRHVSRSLLLKEDRLDISLKKSLAGTANILLSKEVAGGRSLASPSGPVGFWRDLFISRKVIALMKDSGAFDWCEYSAVRLV